MANHECPNVFVNIYLHNQYAIFNALTALTDSKWRLLSLRISFVLELPVLASFLSSYTTELSFLLNIQATI